MQISFNALVLLRQNTILVGFCPTNFRLSHRCFLLGGGKGSGPRGELFGMITVDIESLRLCKIFWSCNPRKNLVAEQYLQEGAPTCGRRPQIRMFFFSTSFVVGSIDIQPEFLASNSEPPDHSASRSPAELRWTFVGHSFKAIPCFVRKSTEW